MSGSHPALVAPFDTMAFSLTEERVVTNDTVRIVVRVHAQKPADSTEAALRSDISRAVRALIDAPDWQLSPARRDTQPTGLETLTLTASVRVPETENHGLKQRAEAVSRPGLALSNCAADSTIPISVVQAAESDLRQSLLRRALDEAVVLSGLCPTMVVHTIDFGGVKTERDRDLVVTRSRGPAGSPAAPEDDVTANSTRISLTAVVTLRRARDTE